MCQFTFLLIFQTILFYGLFFLGGMVLKFFPPKRNKLYGFRTSKALKNDDDWYLAQKMASSFILISASILFIVSMAIKFFTHFLYQALVLYTIIDILLLLLAIFMTYLLTEDRLKKKHKVQSLDDESII